MRGAFRTVSGEEEEVVEMKDWELGMMYLVLTIGWHLNRKHNKHKITRLRSLFAVGSVVRPVHSRKRELVHTFAEMPFNFHVITLSMQ